MVLGLVLHSSHQDRLVEASGTLTGVQLEVVAYDQEKEIRPKVKAMLRRVHLDGMILGLVPYDACRDFLPPDLPLSVTRYTTLELTLTIGRALRQGWAPGPISIDTFDRSIVEDVTSALGMRSDEIACLPYAADTSYDQIIDFHQKFQQENPGGYVITVRSEVTRRLGEKVRLLNVAPLKSSVRAELHELVLRIQSQRARELSFAAGIFSVVGFDKDSNLDRARVGLLNMLLNTPEFADAWVDNRGRRGVVVLAHRALFNDVTQNWSSLPVVGTAHTNLGLRVAAGFGFGIGSSARKNVGAGREGRRAGGAVRRTVRLPDGRGRPDGRAAAARRYTAQLHLPRTWRGPGKTGPQSRPVRRHHLTISRGGPETGRKTVVSWRPRRRSVHHRSEWAAADPQADRQRFGRTAGKRAGQPQRQTHQPLPADDRRDHQRHLISEKNPLSSSGDRGVAVRTIDPSERKIMDLAKQTSAGGGCCNSGR
ncbi:hypothetical protein [Fodinicola feengrottensis]|uniref:hypothetical protein n=1 Tax=Fodinicola feengrottensis TaxID=435914 RepID=UPI00244336EF|nr:hypothetical protein [Fodinicola feengrottensis]